MNILIVEDFEHSILVFKKFLVQHNCYFCESEKTLYENLHKYNFDLIIMDIGLPGTKNGLELIEELKNSTTYKNIPIVCITVHSEIEKDVKNLGVDGFLIKPFNKKELQSTIAEFENI